MKRIGPDELTKITELIHHRHGYDFRNYAMSSFERRVLRVLEIKALTVDTLLKKLSDNPSFVNEFLQELTVHVTEMFRDHNFWTTMRDDIIPSILQSGCQVNIWHAGCSSGEEVFSMAILLREMNVREGVTIFASDLDKNMLARARSGSYPVKSMEINEKNYALFHGNGGSLRNYYTEENGRAVLDKSLLKNITFINHDLVTTGVLNRFDLILCRNVMIYFNQSLQNQVLNKFHQSLRVQGYLAIGSKESLIWSDISGKFLTINAEEKIYRKIKD